MIDNPEFGFTPNNLKSLRKKYGLSQREVAEILDVSGFRTVAKWERSETDMPYTKWKKLLEILKNSEKKCPMLQDGGGFCE